MIGAGVSKREREGYPSMSNSSARRSSSRRTSSRRTSARQRLLNERRIKRIVWILAAVVVVALLVAIKFKTYILTH